MFNREQHTTFNLGGRNVKRLGYGAMQLAGPGVSGRQRILAGGADGAAGGRRLRRQPYRHQRLLWPAHHQPADPSGACALPRKISTLVTKIGARRGSDASWLPAFSAAEATGAVHDNLRNLGLERLDVVNLRIMFDTHRPAEGSIEALLAPLVELQRQGWVRHIGLSNATPAQVAEARARCAASFACRTTTT